MQTWEYKMLYRTRGYLAIEGNSKVQWAEDWKLLEDGVALPTNDALKVINTLGKQGWELVAISPRSGMLSPFGAVAGFTTEELWVFKRPNK